MSLVQWNDHKVIYSSKKRNCENYKVQFFVLKIIINLGGEFNTDNSISLELDVGMYRKVIPNKTAKWLSIIYRYVCIEPFVNSWDYLGIENQNSLF